MIQFITKFLYIVSDKRWVLIGIMASFAISSVLEAFSIGLIGPFLHIAAEPRAVELNSLLRWFYANSGVQSAEIFILGLGIAIALLFVVKSVIYFWARTYVYRYSFSRRSAIANRLLKVYLELPYAFFVKQNTASLINNITHETGKFAQYCLIPVLETISSIIISAAILLLLAYTNLRLLLMIMVVIGWSLFAFYWVSRKRLGRWGETASRENGNMIRVVNHSLGGIKETRVIGCEPHFSGQMEIHAANYAHSMAMNLAFQQLPRVLVEVSLVVFILVFVAISQSLQGENYQDLTAMMGIFAVAALRLIPSISQFARSLGKLRVGATTLDRLYYELKQVESWHQVSIANGDRPEAAEKVSQTSFPISFRSNVTLDNVVYRYPGINEPAINHISLRVNKGESIALIGKSGAGKTTLVDIILGLLTPQSGDICIDGESAYRNLRSWQNLLAYIPQSIFLMDDSIERNIAFGIADGDIDRERLAGAVAAAQLDELVDSLPNGLATLVGERGVRLSGGQRQRIGIARALYHGREILVLDEATSALDMETEQLVNRAIEQLVGTKTIIVIAHRLSTVEHCNRIYLLDKGKIVESGSYQEVVGNTYIGSGVK